MTVNAEKPRWSFYLLWIAGAVLCVPLAFFLNLLFVRIVTPFVGDFVYVAGVPHITEDYFYMYTFIPIAGLLTGLLQYGLLRRYLARMSWWVAMTLGGWLVGVFLDLLPGWLGWTSPLFTAGLAMIVLGLSIGVGQWLLLRRRFPRAGWWIGANVVGWGSLALIFQGPSIGPFELFSLGLLPACATAAVLALLLQPAQTAEPQRL